MASVLSVASRAVLAACECMGLDSEAIVAAAEVDRATLDDPDARLPASTADTIWQQAQQRTSDPSLALYAAEALPFGAYKVLDFIVANAPTIGAGLERVTRYFDLVDPRARFELVGDDPVVLSFAAAHGPLPAPAQEYTFAALTLRSRICSGQGWPLTRVDFTFAEPKNTSEHQRIFDCELRFGQSIAALSIPRASWEQPAVGANEALFGVLDDHAQRLQAELPASEPEVVARVGALLRGELCGGDASAGHIAKLMGMSERTLQRRLSEADRPFVDTLSQVRREMARGYLQQSGVALAEIAWLLGFSDQSAFTRAFKRWEGMSPGAWRKSERAL